jgi:hypothetical protein
MGSKIGCVRDDAMFKESEPWRICQIRCAINYTGNYTGNEGAYPHINTPIFQLGLNLLASVYA